MIWSGPERRREILLSSALDGKCFTSEIASEAHVERIREHIRSGIRSGVNGTPTFFINGIRYDGSWEASDLLAAFEAAAA